MTERVHYHSNLILAPGTKVVTQGDVKEPGGKILHSAGAVGVIIKAPADVTRSYLVRMTDGSHHEFLKDEIRTLAQVKEGVIGDSDVTAVRSNLFERVIFRCVVGSRAFGLEDEHSDTDRRGIYLPTAESHWSLYGVPEQIENDETQEAYWELQKFIILALKANPNVLECLHSPLVEYASPLAKELLELRTIFLSRLVYQTYNGYVFSQFKKMQADIRHHGQVKWKHVMHLLRLLLSGIHLLETGSMMVHVGEHRDRLLEIKQGSQFWEECESWREQLHRAFDVAYQDTNLPPQPDYERANEFLLKARRLATNELLP